MSLLNGIILLLVCQLLGEGVKAWWQLSLPGPVIGMFILLLGLCLFRGVPEGLNKSSQTLIPLLGLMFLPATTGLFFLGSDFNSQWPAIIVATVLGTILSLLFNGLVMRWLMRKGDYDD